MSRHVRNVIGLVLFALSFVALVPGLREPLITISASFALMGNKIDLFEETRSILQTVQSLRDDGNDFVAGLIFLFGVVVPIVKGLTLVAAFLVKNHMLKRRFAAFVRAISKWAMNDVFVVAVYVAFLSARATDNLDARIEPGFYWFTGYCLLSLLSLQFLKVTPDEIPPGVSGVDVPIEDSISGDGKALSGQRAPARG